MLCKLLCLLVLHKCFPAGFPHCPHFHTLLIHCLGSHVHEELPELKSHEGKIFSFQRIKIQIEEVQNVTLKNTFN